MQDRYIDNDECTYLLFFSILAIKRCEGLPFGYKFKKRDYLRPTARHQADKTSGQLATDLAVCSSAKSHILHPQEQAFLPVPQRVNFLVEQAGKPVPKKLIENGATSQINQTFLNILNHAIDVLEESAQEL
ncbi:hypothetical protein QUA43_21445 [Microcoleus sp. N9_B4]|uniref:hypothetical protein n=1 Tax=Microcoleus sp. N9_B4 TaxID=3055386 RepID=UPI002FD2FCD0